MKNDKIILKLTELNKDINSHDLHEFIEELKQDYMMTNYNVKSNKKTRLTGIKRVLNYKSNKARPILQCFTPLNNGGVAITDSYQLYILKDDVLPFNVAFMNDYDNRDEYLGNNPDLKVECGCYPNVTRLTPDVSTAVDTMSIKASEIVNLYKITEKENNFKIYTFNKNGVKFTIDLIKLKTCIDILGLTDDVIIYWWDEKRPIVIKNDDDETGLILPIVTY